VTSAQVTIDGNTRQSSPKANRERGLDMLAEIKRAIKDNYYDPKFRGINIDERFKLAAERIKTLNTYWQIFREIAQTVVDFNDSHTRFLPPSWANRPEYGFSLQMIGDTCYLVDVKKGSDAEAKGLKVGDVVLALGQYAVTRETLWKLNYLLYQIDPQEVLTLSIQSPDGRQRTVWVRAKFKTPAERLKETRSRETEKKQRPFKCNEVSTDLIACKLYTFLVDRDEMDKMMKEVRRHNKFILDLRGNRGGYVTTVAHLTGYFFDHDVKISVEVTREKTKERIAKNLKEKAYHGELVVLIDSASASASELFARVIQIEKRGKIVGDVSAGAVMASRVFGLANLSGVFNVLVVGYAVNVSVGDSIMSDGKRLEGTGVMPDARVGPTGRALLEGNDPVLSHAASLLGVKLTPEQAGKLYFIAKQPEDEEIEGKDEDK
jgi:carboxyl-terminal processing protease